MQYGDISSKVSGNRMILSVKKDSKTIEVSVIAEGGCFEMEDYIELLNRLKAALKNT